MVGEIFAAAADGAGGRRRDAVTGFALGGIGGGRRGRCGGGTGKEGAVPSGVTAQLRDYQVAGFQWMCLLHEMGWGGCLADDMGLGKTLQTLSFLRYVVERYPLETHLVVCPTSLLYNWESEMKKFVPDLAV